MRSFGLKKIKGSFTKYIAAAIILICTITLVALGIRFTRSSVLKKSDSDTYCSQIVQSVRNQMNRRDYKKSLVKLKNANCSESHNKLIKTTYLAEYAIATYDTGDKSSAKDYANKALIAAKSLSTKERQQIVNFENMVIILQDITRGAYDGIGSWF